MPFFSCFRGKRRSNTSAAIPHFQITQIPEDGVNALLQRKRHPEVSEEIAAPAPAAPVSATSNWKPYHNATVAVSSVLKQRNPQPPLAAEDYYHQQHELSRVEEPLKDEPEKKKMIRSPTPDALALFETNELPASSTMTDSIAASLVDLESLLLLPPVDDSELFEDQNNETAVILGDPILNHELEELFKEAEFEPIQDEQQRNGEIGDEQWNEVETEKEQQQKALIEVEDLELALEVLFLEALVPTSVLDSTIDSGDLTPNTLALRLPMRCKTRVTEMATWFEKQMSHPEHNETFQEPAI